MLDVEPQHFKRSGSERIKDGAKALLKRMESIKTKKKKKPSREGVLISGPLVGRAEDDQCGPLLICAKIC